MKLPNQLSRNKGGLLTCIHQLFPTQEYSNKKNRRLIRSIIANHKNLFIIFLPLHKKIINSENKDFHL